MAPVPVEHHPGVHPENVAALARRTLTDRLQAVARLLRPAAERADPDTNAEQIHQLRVATRRAAVAVDLFGELLTEAQAAWWKGTLKEIRESANAARDDDVLNERLRQETGSRDAARLLRRGLEHRRSAQQPLRDVADRLLSTGALENSTAALSAESAAAAADPAGERVDLREWATSRLRTFRRRFLKAARRDLRDPHALHRFRIRTKQLRYALETVSGLLPADNLAGVLKTVEKLQDRLGRINDHRSAADRFRRWEREAEDADEIAYLRANRRAEQKAFRSTRDDALCWWTPRRRERLQRRLKRLLRRDE